MYRGGQITRADQLLIRELNLSLILRSLWAEKSISRARLAEVTGLNKTTVSSLVRELAEAGFVRDTGVYAHGAGRPSLLLELNPDAGVILVAELRADSFTTVLADFNTRIIWRQDALFKQPHDVATSLEQVRLVINAAVHEAGNRPPLALVLGVPGLVDVRQGRLLFAPTLGWREVDLAVWAQTHFSNISFFVNNEATMAALGEQFFGAAAGHSDVLYISAGAGLGGGLVRGGEIADGATGFAGEFGHMRMQPDGVICSCGKRGCWETLANHRALLEHVRTAINSGQPSMLSSRVADSLDQSTISVVAEAARAGDTVALGALQAVGTALGIGIANLVNALNPEQVVFGGTLAVAGDLLLPVIRRTVVEEALTWPAQAASIVLAAHGADACLIGGIALAYQHVLENPKLNSRSAS